MNPYDETTARLIAAHRSRRTTTVRAPWFDRLTARGHVVLAIVTVPLVGGLFAALMWIGGAR